MKKSKYKSIFQIAVSIILVFIFFSSSVLFIFVRNNIFPLINGIVLFTFLFLFKGRYRIYAFIFFSSFTKCMIPINSRIGSFLTWNMLIYLIIILIERIFYKGKTTKKEWVLIFSYICFVCFALLSDIVNITNVSLLKFASAISYLSIPLVISIDSKAEKSIPKMLIVFSCSILFMNMFAFTFVYILKPFTNTFINAYLPKHQAQLNYYQSNYRFSGLTGDPNHNSLYILMAVSLNILFLKRIKKGKALFHILNILMLVFGIIGQSKTFLLATILVFVLLMVEIGKDKSNLPIVFFFSISVIILSLLLAVSIPTLSRITLRFIDLDDRVGFLEAFTTQRMHIWKNYLSYLSKNPIKTIIGHGVWPTYKLFNWDYHNSFIQLLWEYGVFGSFFFILYMGRFIVPKSKNKKFIYYLPSILLLFFGLSLHIIYDEFIYSGLYIYNNLLENDDSVYGLNGHIELVCYYEINV